jgi:hypothetical protein
LGVAGDLRGAERSTSGVNFFARTVILKSARRKECDSERRREID